jgi:Domain of unknown function (DUF5615)
VRLLLDQHYSPTIAQHLRDRGHDVVSAEEDSALRGRADREIWTYAIAERRAVLTEDVSHFVALVRECLLAGERHFGVVFTTPRSMPRGRGTIGLFVKTLDGFLDGHPADDALADQVAWLSPNPG